jgi:hypothetical protein
MTKRGGARGGHAERGCLTGHNHLVDWLYRNGRRYRGRAVCLTYEA